MVAELFDAAVKDTEWGEDWLEVVNYFLHQETLMDDSLLAVPVLVAIYESHRAETAFVLAADIEKVRRATSVEPPRLATYRDAVKKLRHEVFNRMAEETPISDEDLHWLIVHAASFRNNLGLSWALGRYDGGELASGEVAAREDIDYIDPNEWKPIGSFEIPRIKNIGLMLDVDGDIAALLGGGEAKKVVKLGIDRDPAFIYKLENGVVLRCRRGG